MKSGIKLFQIIKVAVLKEKIASGSEKQRSNFVAPVENARHIGLHRSKNVLDDNLTPWIVPPGASLE